MSDERDIYEVANQLEGYVGPDTDDKLAAFLMREGKEAAKLADTITTLRSQLSGMTEETSSWVAEIAAERRRQVEVEGWTPEHDDQHASGDLARAAACYAISRPIHEASPAMGLGGRAVRSLWPWDWRWWKPTDRRRDLVKAGALILAEIERLDRRSALGEHP